MLSIKKDFEYYGIVLSENSRNLILETLQENEKFATKLSEIEKPICHHCTLLHVSQLSEENEISKQIYFNIEAIMSLKKDIKITVTHVGISNLAMAVKVKFPKELKGICFNSVPHITIGVFNGGKPVDSNYIEHWEQIEPFNIIGKIKKHK